jgi:DNA repair protein RecO (recombination protein O)
VELDGIIIDLIPIKEQDAMAHILTSSGIVTPFAPRAMSQKSAYYSALQPFSSGHYWIREGQQGGLKLQQAKLDRYFGDKYETLTQMTLLGLIKETLSSISGYEGWDQIYDLVSATLIQGANNVKLLTLITLYIHELLTILGWGLNLDGCVVCGTKQNLVAIDRNQGGFVCRAHYQETATSTGKETLIAWSLLGKCHVTTFDECPLEDETSKKLLVVLKEHYLDLVGRELKSLKLLNL